MTLFVSSSQARGAALSTTARRRSEHVASEQQTPEDAAMTAAVERAVDLLTAGWQLADGDDLDGQLGAEVVLDLDRQTREHDWEARDVITTVLVIAAHERAQRRYYERGGTR